MLLASEIRDARVSVTGKISEVSSAEDSLSRSMIGWLAGLPLGNVIAEDTEIASGGSHIL